jgi:hypothetical protein
MCKERYDGGDAYTEADRLQALAKRILWVQKRLQERNRTAHPLRAFHAKIRLGVENARLVIDPAIPAQWQVGFAQPAREYPAVVRLSNASGSLQPDYKRDMRGVAVRIQVSEAEYHDFLLTNGPVSHARNGNEFVAFAEALAGSRLKLPFRLLFGLGPFTTLRMVRTLLRHARAGIGSLATETYWSRGALRWGGACGRLKLAPAGGAGRTDAPPAAKYQPDYLRTEMADRLRVGSVEFVLSFQPFVDESKTPIENAAKEWREADAPFVPIARLVIPQQDVDSGEGQAAEERVDRLAFNPWHTTDEFRPLGHINRARKAVYLASSAHRLGHRFLTEVPVRNRVFGWLARAAFRVLNVFVPWHRLQPRLGSLNLLGFRHILRRDNLIDTEDRDAPPAVVAVPVTIPEGVRDFRTDDGAFNDLSVPRMGAEPDPGPPPVPGATFGRNVPLAAVRAALAQFATANPPNPVEVSERLLARRVFLPAKSLNLLAAAWIQFQVHDWVDHPRRPWSQGGASPVEVPVPGGRTWRNTEGGPDERVMRISENVRRPTRDPQLDGIPVFENQDSPWWDASQVYGNSPAQAAGLRARDGDRVLAELRLEDGFLPPSSQFPGLEDTGFNENWWLGLSLMHTLFAREHNVLVAALRREYPGWTEDSLYRTARMVLAALVAKIHTVEWTPAILATKTIDMALKGNWYGAPKDWLSQLGIWLTEAHALKGIPETLPDHHAAPYSLTEEFVTVYRMHPLVPDAYRFVSGRTSAEVPVTVPTPGGGTEQTTTPTFWQIQGAHTGAVMRQIGLSDVVYSFACAHPGAITLQNYPSHLRNFTRRNGERIDLAVVDLVRERSRGIPPYNEFRRLLHKPKVRDFSEITSNQEWAAEMRDVYRGDVEAIDTMVGLLAENPPEGFGFSDTAFRIFILMASRRLQSDRFFTVDYRPEVYSPLGLDWIARTGMKEVIERHCPGLARCMPRDASAFAPWRPVGEG